MLWEQAKYVGDHLAAFEGISLFFLKHTTGDKGEERNTSRY